MTEPLAAARRGEISFDDLEEWAGTDWANVWPVFQRGARGVRDNVPALRAAQPHDRALMAVLDVAASLGATLDRSAVRAFFESHFTPHRVEPSPSGADGFLTGYYEPIVEGSPVRSRDFEAPILPRPPDLVTISQGAPALGLPAGYSAGRRRPDGTLAIYLDRAAIEASALTAAAEPVVWLRDWTEVFLIHVQGSARVRLPDGSEMRLVYAGRNGHPYTSIGRRLIETGEIAPRAMSLEALKNWLRRNGQDAGEAGRRLMQENRSYIFFRAEALEPTAPGPTGGAGLPLTPLRSIAIDRTLWSYGLPFWIETTEPVPGFGPHPLRRLFIAQDTGSAILGPARADLFLGSGDEAGRQAGGIRHAARFTALIPRAA